MKKIIVSTALLIGVSFNSIGYAGIPVTCVNCSTSMVQSLEYVKDIEQLMESIARYNELVKQTENMIKNTLNFDPSSLSQLLAMVTNSVDNLSLLESYINDMDTLEKIFSGTWPELDDMTIDGKNMTYLIQQRRNQYMHASRQIDDVLSSNFQLSGKQLQDLQNNGHFESYMSDLLSSKQGQLDAIEAGNQINALTVAELRETRALMANYVQAQSTALAQAEAERKQEQLIDEKWDEGTLNMSVDDFPNGYTK